MPVVDLDQGGRIPQNVRTYLGPTTGWKMTDSPVDLEFAIEGGGGIILNGVKAPLVIPDWLTIYQWYILSTVSGSMVVDVRLGTLDDYLDGILPNVSICGSEIPTLTNAVSAQGSLTSGGIPILPGWEKRINQNDVISLNVSGVANVVAATLILRCIRNIGPS